MKNFLKITFVFPVLALMACSSMDVDDADADNWPSDFKANEYAQINPIFVNLQIIDDIVIYNNEWKAKLYAAAANSTDSANVKLAISSDSSEFFADTANLHTIFSTYAGYPDSSWTGYESSPAVAKTAFLYKFNYLGKSSADGLTSMRLFAADTTALKLQYVLYGEVEGRPYRYCKANEAKTLRSLSQAASISAKSGIPDYRPNYYCCNAAEGSACTDDSQIYLIQQ